MFSPIVAMAPFSVSSTVAPSLSFAALIAARLPSVASAASAMRATRLWKSAFRATKSVSELTSTMTALPRRRGDADQAFGRDAAGLLGRLGETLGAEPVDGCFHVAAGFGQRILAVHHAHAGLLAELLHHSSGNRHLTLFRSLGADEALRLTDPVVARDPPLEVERLVDLLDVLVARGSRSGRAW